MSEPASETDKKEHVSVLEKKDVVPTYAVEIQPEKYAFQKPVFGINKITRDSAFSSKKADSPVNRHVQKTETDFPEMQSPPESKLSRGTKTDDRALSDVIDNVE